MEKSKQSTRQICHVAGQSLVPFKWHDPALLIRKPIKTSAWTKTNRTSTDQNWSQLQPPDSRMADEIRNRLRRPNKYKRQEMTNAISRLCRLRERRSEAGTRQRQSECWREIRTKAHRHQRAGDGWREKRAKFENRDFKISVTQVGRTQGLGRRTSKDSGHADILIIGTGINWSICQSMIAKKLQNTHL